MEKLAALININTKRVDSIIVVADHKNLQSFSSETHDCVAVEDGQTAFLHGLFDGKDFSAPDNDYLIQLGLLKPEVIDTEE